MRPGRDAERRSLRRRAALACFVTLLLAGNAVATKKEAMDLRLTLSLDRTELVAGEDTRLVVTTRNVGDRTLSVPDPARGPAHYALRVRDLERGTDREIQIGAASPASHAFAPELPAGSTELEPEKAIEDESTLLARVPDLAAGRYRLVAEFGYADERIESGPVDVVVAPLDLAGLDVASSQAGFAPFAYHVWSQGGSSGAALLETFVGFDPEAEPTVLFSNRLADPGGGIAPVLSVARNGTPSPGQWIAWLQGDTLRALHVFQGSVDRSPAPQRISLAGAHLVGPLLAEVDPSDPTRPGRADVVLAAGSSLALRVLEPDGSLTGEAARGLGSGEIVWARDSFLSNGQRCALAVLHDGDTLRVVATRWDGQRRPGAVERIGEVEGAFVAAALGTESDDSLELALLARSQAGDGASLVLRRWTLAANKVDAQAPVRFGRGAAEASQALLAVGPAASLAALFRDRDGRWSVGNAAGEVVTLRREPRAGEARALFFPAPAQPYVLWSDPSRGLRWVRLAAGHAD
jgi:hypothetical protein